MNALLVLLAVFAIYLQSLGGPFLWDDRLLVLDWTARCTGKIPPAIT
jgi:hypothetical protein